MQLSETFNWRGRHVRWASVGAGPPVVFCHGTPFSSYVWSRFATALSEEYTTYVWDMPGYGQSSKHPDHPVGLDEQGRALAGLLDHWGLAAPHVVAHDFGGAVALRAHLLHGRAYASLALVDAVALAPWGTPFFRLVRSHPEVFDAVPAAMHEGALRAYVAGASRRGLTPADLDALVDPWLGPEGQAAFYRQIAQADPRHTDEVEGRYPEIDLPTLVVWGADDTWLPAEQGRRLARLIPGARLDVVPGAGHLVQLDQPVRLATTLHRWLAERQITATAASPH